MPYNPAFPNAFDRNLIPEKIRDRYFEEYLALTPISYLMGTSANDAIQVFEMSKGEGMSYHVAFRKELNYEDPIIGFDQASGSEQEIKFFEDKIDLNILRWADKLRGVPVVGQQTPIDVYGAMRPSLLNVQQRYLVKSILDSGTIRLYNSGTGGNGPLIDRVVYGNKAYNASIFTAVGTFNGATYDKCGMSVKHLRKLKSMAINGGIAFEKESRLRPIELKTRRGFPEETYIYLMDPESYVSLSQDPEWKDFVYRGVIQGNDQPEGISGARYRGMVEGVLVYECPELAPYRVTNGERTAAWNLFLGAQAFGLVWSYRPWFEMEHRDFNLNVAMAVCEIRGQKALMFPSFQDQTKLIEKGIIHSFVQI